MEKVTVSVTPGICGFKCKVTATRESKREASIEVIDSECEMINEMATCISTITIKDIFKGHTKDKIFRCTEIAKCHLCCPVPIAIIKASEVALELALPEDVNIHFE